jgi:hypothetical protein
MAWTLQLTPTRSNNCLLNGAVVVNAGMDAKEITVTLKDHIYNTLRNNPESHFTNQQLARELNAPEPSVRRATLALEQALLICVVNAYSGKNVLEWRVRRG